MARDLSALLGRAPASANDYRKLIGERELDWADQGKVTSRSSRRRLTVGRGTD